MTFLGAGECYVFGYFMIENAYVDIARKLPCGKIKMATAGHTHSVMLTCIYPQSSVVHDDADDNTVLYFKDRSMERMMKIEIPFICISIACFAFCAYFKSGLWDIYMSLLRLTQMMGIFT